MAQRAREDEARDQDLDRLDLGEVKRFLARRWVLIVGTCFGAGVLALVACLSMTPIYTATSQVLLDPTKQRVFGQESVNTDLTLDSAVVDSQIPIILSSRTLSYVVTREHLTEDPEFAAAGKPGILGRLMALFGPPRAAHVDPPSLDGIDPKLVPVISSLFAHVDVARVAKSNVLSITVSSRDPSKAARLANAMANAYVADQIDVHARSVQQAANFFEERLGRLRDQVRASERAVADFRKANGLATTSDEKVTVSEQQLSDLNEKLATASSDTAEKLARYQQATRFKGGAGDLDTLPEVVRSPVIAQLRAQLADVARRESDLLVTYGSAYPAVAQIRAQRQGLNAAMAAEVKRLVAALKNDYEVAKAREDTLRRTMIGLGNLSNGDNDVGVKLRELERTNLANKALFENFLNRAKLTQEQSTFEAPDARVISPALIPGGPSSPKTKLIVPVAAVAGLIIGLGIAAILDLLQSTASPPKPVPGSRERSEPAVIGYVPPVEAVGGAAFGGLTSALSYMERFPGSDFTRGIRAAAETLAAAAKQQRQVVVLLPLARGEGASTLARCLSATLGTAHKRVLVIDADSAGRSLTTGLSLSSRPGLGEVLSGTVTVGAAVVARPSFAFLPVGQAGVDLTKPTQLRRFKALIKEARERFDLILIDAPPLDRLGSAKGWQDAADRLVLVASWKTLLDERFVPLVDGVTAAPSFAGLLLNRTMPPAEIDDLALAS